MGHAETMRTLTGISCGLQSLNSYLDARQKGQTPQVATTNLVGNIFNGLMRNEMAYDMQKCGNSAGNILNSTIGYGNPTSNAIGTLGMMSAYAYTPWMFFNSPCCFNYNYSMNYSYFGGGGFYC
ncbi:MAG: hypothetical protein SPL73_00985 [Cyanobacteriota bacterium]|nr:hypothetical protein [Cyanobacteriota bacterium]MDY6359003.1 hypothetical protein [Cyanobacteriota bacterium]MDY6363445.1 hypothetical protein [Cyanobacteriota bacterium]